MTYHATHAKKGENGTPKEDPWCWCHHFCPDQVPPSICLDHGEVPKPQELPEASGVQDAARGGQDNQLERSTVTHHHSQRLLECQWQSPIFIGDSAAISLVTRAFLFSPFFLGYHDDFMVLPFSVGWLAFLPSLHPY